LGKGDAIESIAVIPLENLSGDPDQQYFADGMTEAMITELSRISGLKVTSRRSAMKFKDSDLSTTEIAEQLGVDALVQGSVIREGDDVRITARLISGTADEQLWGDSFDREISGILKLHAEVAQAIAQQVEVSLTDTEQARLASADNVDPEAYEAYLRGQYHLWRLGPDEIATAEANFNRALEIDPDFAPAVAGLHFAILAGRQMGLVSPKEAAVKSKELRNRALQLDSTLSEAHLAAAGIETWSNWNWEAGEKLFLRAIDTNPNNAEARAFYSHLLNILCRPDEAREQIELAVELDPLNEFIRSLYAVDLAFFGAYDEAIAQALEALRTSPANTVAMSVAKASYKVKGDTVKAFEFMRRINLARQDSALVEVLDRGFELGGFKVATREAARSLVARADTAFVPYLRIAGFFTEAGLYDEAFEWFDDAMAAHDPSMPYMSAGFGPFVALRDDPRFLDILTSMDLAPCGE
jgi:TolB-like protein